MGLYKACDIRGETALLSAELYHTWGRRLASQLEGARNAAAGSPTVFVGGDVRVSTPQYLEALITGIEEGGVQAVDLGIVPTPLVYFAKRQYHADACAIVTASHSPPDINGLKWMLGNLPPTEAEVAAMQQPLDISRPPATRARQELDAFPDYERVMASQWGRKELRHCRRAVLDPGTGCWSGHARRVLQRIYPSMAISTIHDAPDGRFPLRNPDSAHPKYLTRLCDTVRSEGADLGIAFDGDGDRVAFVDHEGHALSAEENTWALIHSFGQELDGESFVHDIKFSDKIAATVRGFGGKAIAERSGHAFIRTRMLKEQALFGAEISGHYFYRALEGGDDGLFTACRMIDYLERSGLRLATVRRACPPIFMTPDLRVSVSTEARAAALAKIRDTFENLPQRDIDGVRIEFPNGWALVRGSVTEDVLTFRFEGADETTLAEVIDGFCRRVPRYGEAIRGKLGRQVSRDSQDVS